MRAIAFAILAAVLYGISAPLSKLLLAEIPPTLMAALLYLGAGLGMMVVNFGRQIAGRERREAKLTQKELPLVAAMVLLDILAPLLLMLGLTMTTAANASLLNNFEIVATSIIALAIFQEAIGRRMWLAIAIITTSTMVLSFEDLSSLDFSPGSLLVIAACLSWGFENNCTRMLSSKDPFQIVVIKGLGSGCGALLIALLRGEVRGSLVYLILALLLGFVAYGLSIFFYISAQRELGAARTSAFYAAAPFLGVILSWLILHESLTATFGAALALMLIGSYLAVSEDHGHTHVHDAVTHEHRHHHPEEHHHHSHGAEDEIGAGTHSHLHTHAVLEHRHAHTPDLHHRHRHES